MKVFTSYYTQLQAEMLTLSFPPPRAGLRLAGSGSAGPSDLLEEWARTYLYVRDDIRFSFFPFHLAAAPSLQLTVGSPVATSGLSTSQLS